jgi:hypothetical protein
MKIPGQISVKINTQRLLKISDAPSRAPIVIYSGIDDGVPL